MNYIAHAVISNDFEHFMMGQLLGDYAVNHILKTCHPEIRRGVEAHRALDRYTDSLDEFQQGCKLLETSVSRYAPVVMDVVIDRVLVVNWEKKLQVSGQSFQKFLEQMYEALDCYHQDLPERMRTPALRMFQMDWFSGFASLSDFERVFFFMSRRVRKPELMLAAPGGIAQNWNDLEDLSLEILKKTDLRNFSKTGF